MCHAWTAFIVLCTSLPLALMAWFAFPVSAIPEEKEPMKNLGSRVIRGPNPRPYPPEGVLVDQLSTIIPTLDDHALSKAAGGLNVERDPSTISGKYTSRYISLHLAHTSLTPRSLNVTRSMVMINDDDYATC